jgi:hypothetical protein
MHLLMAGDALSAYPNHNNQIGAYIMQEDHPIAYYNKKLKSIKKNYTSTEKEMLSIIATLEEICSMILSANIYVYTNHRT